MKKVTERLYSRIKKYFAKTEKFFCYLGIVTHRRFIKLQSLLRDDNVRLAIHYIKQVVLMLYYSYLIAQAFSHVQSYLWFACNSIPHFV